MLRLTQLIQSSQVNSSKLSALMILFITVTFLSLSNSNLNHKNCHLDRGLQSVLKQVVTLKSLYKSIPIRVLAIFNRKHTNQLLVNKLNKIRNFTVVKIVSLPGCFTIFPGLSTAVDKKGREGFRRNTADQKRNLKTIFWFIKRKEVD